MANLAAGYSDDMRRTPEQRMMRWMTAGAYTMRHWRGVLLSIWLGTVALFGLFAWWGFANRDGGFGAFVFFVFGFTVLAMVIRYPRRLFRSFVAARRSPGQTPARAGGVIDTEADVRERPRRDPPPLGPHRG